MASERSGHIQYRTRIECLAQLGSQLASNERRYVVRGGDDDRKRAGRRIPPATQPAIAATCQSRTWRAARRRLYVCATAQDFRIEDRLDLTDFVG